ncbi:MAG: hypothetical protein K1X64_11645 [Myxococcaceae bacterium]|nr:hypothetical protein [Myxococcaceae bacterium]
MAGEVFYGARLTVRACTRNIIGQALLGVALLAHWAAAAEDETPSTWSGSASLWTGAGVDTNPARDFVTGGATTPLDGMVSAIAQLEAQARGERGRLSGRYDVGARKFMRLPSEDTVIQSAVLDGSLYAGRYFDFGLLARARDRRGAERDYTDLSAEAYLGFTPSGKVDLRVFGGAHRFLYWNGIAASFYTPTVSFSVRYRFDKRHSMSVTGNYEPRLYNALSFPNPGLDPPEVRAQRSDNVFTAGISYAYRGPFALTVAYSYVDSTSNSWGETYRRHRGTLTAGVKLPWRWTFLGNLALQWAQYPDHMFLSQDLNISEDDENQNAVSVKFVRPLGEHFAFDARYAFYFNRLVTTDYTYLRQVAMLGVSAKW